MLEILELFFILLVVLSIVMALRLIWATFKLRTHPAVESVETAHPELAEYLKALVSDIAEVANIPNAPHLHIRRAALPNAFIVASIFKPDLFLTDELLEHCNSMENGLDELTMVLCHEIAHLKRHDAIPLGLLTYAEQWGDKLQLNGLKHSVQKQIQKIESETDKVANNLFQQLKG